MKKGIIWSYDLGEENDKAKQDMAFDFETIYGYSPNTTELNQYIENYRSAIWTDFLHCVLNEEKRIGNKSYIVYARIQRWNGYFYVREVIEGLYETIDKCITGSDYWILKYERKQFVIVTYHHDGTNIFKIRELTERGKQYFINYKNRKPHEILCERLYNFNQYSKKVRIIAELEGDIR